MKLIIIIAIIAICYYIFFRKKSVSNEKTDEGVTLLECSECKTFVPANTLVKYENRYVCKDCYDNLRA